MILLTWTRRSCSNLPELLLAATFQWTVTPFTPLLPFTLIRNRIFIGSNQKLTCQEKSCKDFG